MKSHAYEIVLSGDHASIGQESWLEIVQPGCELQMVAIIRRREQSESAVQLEDEPKSSGEEEGHGRVVAGPVANLCGARRGLVPFLRLRDRPTESDHRPFNYGRGHSRFRKLNQSACWHRIVGPTV